MKSVAQDEIYFYALELRSIFHSADAELFFVNGDHEALLHQTTNSSLPSGYYFYHIVKSGPTEPIKLHCSSRAIKEKNENFQSTNSIYDCQ